MAINYSVTPRKNPKNPQDPAKYYAQTQVVSEYSFDDLCADLEAMSTLTEGDIKATTVNMVHCISSALRNGRSVRLGELGHKNQPQQGSEQEAALLGPDILHSFHLTGFPTARIFSLFYHKDRDAPRGERAEKACAGACRIIQ